MRVENKFQAASEFGVVITPSNIVDGTVALRLDSAEAGPLVYHLDPEQLAEALNQIDGFEVTFKTLTPLPENVGAVVGYSDTDVRLVRVFTGPGKNWVQNLSGTQNCPTWYTDRQVSGFLNGGGYEVLSEGAGA